MKTQIISEVENPLLKRKEVKMLVNDYEATPNRQEILKAVASELKTDEKKMIVDKIDQEYGKKEAVCYIKVYETKEDKRKYEEEYKLKRIGDTKEVKETAVKEIAAETKPDEAEKETAKEAVDEVKENKAAEVVEKIEKGE